MRAPSWEVDYEGRAVHHNAVILERTSCNPDKLDRVLKRSYQRVHEREVGR